MKNYQITSWVHHFLEDHVQPGDVCIDATMGNGVAMASSRIGGVVLDDNDASPLIGATVVLSDEMGKQVMGVTTDAHGRFLIKEVEVGCVRQKV